MTSNTLSYSDMPDERLSRATSMGGVLQQLSVSLGVSLAAVLLSLVSGAGHVLAPAQFHQVFLLSAVIPLISVPGFFGLSPQDGVRSVSHERAIAEAETAQD